MLYLVSPTRITISPDARVNAEFAFTDEQAEESFFSLASQCFGFPYYIQPTEAA